MIEPFLEGDAFLEDVRGARARGGFHIWWLGQSGFLIQQDGRHILLDPYLSDSLTRKYAGTDKPHVRMPRRVIDPARLDFIDVVTSSHNHTDHLDGETLRPLIQANPRMAIVVPEANRAFAAERIGVEPARLIGVDDGVTVGAGFAITGVPAAHETVERDAAGRHVYLGYVIDTGKKRVYHSGDTVLHEGMVERLRPFGVDIALLPINGRSPERRVAGNLDGPEAARLARDIGAKLAIPCHYEMFEFNTASPEGFVAEAERLGQPVRVLQAGERWSG